MELVAFDSQLRAACNATVQAIPGITLDDLRPFVCKGSPLLCPVFLVGMNPASSDKGFWRYWSVAGFDYDSWFRYYTASRSAAGKRSSISPTRARIQVFTADGEFVLVFGNDELTPAPASLGVVDVRIGGGADDVDYGAYVFMVVPERSEVRKFISSEHYIYLHKEPPPPPN